LLSYITSRYGVVKEVSEISGEIQQLFNQMYTLTYDEEIEIRYKTVTSSYIDEAGNEQTESHEEAYEYKSVLGGFLKQEKRNVLILYITMLCFLIIGIVTAAIFISSGNYISLVLTLSSYFIVYTILNTKLIKRSMILRQLYKELENKDI